MTETIDAVVAGAGVVGLAVARALALAGHDVIVLEAESLIGSVTSARNSEVIHAGIYYPTGSLKAELCVRGKAMLYEYCASHGVAHRNCQKLIVATNSDQVGKLETIREKAHANGVTDLDLLTQSAAQALEPTLACQAALLSPSTGIIDSHGLMLALQGDLEDHGGVVAFNSPLIGGQIAQDGISLSIGGEAPLQLKTRLFVNAAGLAAQRIAHQINGLNKNHIPPLHLARGNYFSLGKKAPFSRLIYPVPEPGGLGVHLTLDLAGLGRFGPDVEWVSEEDYTVDPRRAEGFYAAIRRYWPDLPEGALQPDYAGIRPKLVGRGGGDADFMVQGPEVHGVTGLVHLFGIESPGLTACLALAELVTQKLA